MELFIMTTSEKRQLMLKWREEPAIILKDICEKCAYSKAIVDLPVDHPLFEDSCNFVELHSRIMEFVHTLKSMNVYTKIIMNHE